MMLKGEKHEPWQPILDGSLREAAWGAVREIAIALRKTKVKDPSLAGGSAGLALFYAYLARVSPELADEDLVIQTQNQAVDTVSSIQMDASLYGGFTGIAWVVEHLRKYFFDMDGENPNEDIDQVLESYLRQSPWRRDYDLIIGLVGIGVYALERLPHPVAITCLKHVIERLDEIAERQGKMLTWHTDAALLPRHQRKIAPRGYYNLGLAHGVPGVIAFLGLAWTAGIERRKVRRILNGAVRWLLQQKLRKGLGSTYSSWKGFGIPPMPCRSAWCYGDPGVAAALLSASRSANQSNWEKEALVIARAAAKRPPHKAGVVDAGLCHGSAGLGHIFNRIFQSTGEAIFKKAAQFWFQRTLELRRPGKGIAGFSAYAPSEKGKVAWHKEPGLLSGAAGIGLALLAATTNVRPDWDRMLLTSIESRKGGNL